MTKLSCSAARKNHFVTCATREDPHYISTLENNFRSTQVPWGWPCQMNPYHENINTHSNVHPIVKINVICQLGGSYRKNCDRGLEIAARGRRPRASFSRPMSQFFAIRTDNSLVNNFFFFSLPSSLKITCFNCWLASRLIANAVLKRLTNWTFQREIFLNTWWAISIHYMIKGVYKNVETDLDKKLLKNWIFDCNCGLHQSD